MRLMTCIWDATDVSGSELLVLLALADHANDAGICWPSLPRIAKRARLSERQTQRVIQKLASEGHIKILSKGDGRGHSTMYQITIKGDNMSAFKPEKGDELTPFQPAKVDNMTPLKDDKMSTFVEERVTSAPIKGDIAMSTESIQKPKRKKKSIAADAAPPDLPEWQEFIMGLCNCCYKHTDIAALSAKDKGILLSEAKKIHDKGYTLEDIRKWFATEWVKDWRYGENKNRPTPSQVCSGLPAIRAAPDEAYELPVNTNGAMSEAKKNAIIMRGKSAQQKIRTAEYTGTSVNPQWHKDIEAARGLI